MFYADNYQLSTTFYKQQQTWVEWRVGRGEESLCHPTSLCEDQRARERAQSVEGRRGIWQIIFDISRGFVGKIQIFWMQCSQLAQWKDIFTIVPDVMLDDWQLKCLILQDRNLHDDTVTQCQADAGISVQRRDFYILGNSVNSGGWWRHGSSFLDNSVRGGFVGEWRAQPYHWADESCGPSCESLRCITTKNSTSPAIFCRKNLRKYNFYLNR